MKRLALLLFVGLIAASAYGIKTIYRNARPAGTDTQLNHWIYVEYDSVALLDSAQADTFYSDTMDIGDYQWMTVGVSLTGFVVPDSITSDSVVVIMQGYGSYNGQMERLIFTDTFPETPATPGLDSTYSTLTPIKTDSMGINKFYIRTIVIDSILYLSSDIDTATTADTLKLELIYEITQTKEK